MLWCCGEVFWLVSVMLQLSSQRSKPWPVIMTQVPDEESNIALLTTSQPFFRRPRNPKI